LDAYPGAAAAYSLRKLRTAYTGAAIRINRSSDSAQTDIFFDGNGQLDILTLTTFVGLSTSQIVIWYDQSGNGRNGTPFNQANAPRIIISGVLQTQLSKPTIAFFTSILCGIQTGYTLNNPFTMIGVLSQTSGANLPTRIFCSEGTGNLLTIARVNVTSVFTNGVICDFPSKVLGQPYLVSFSRQSTTNFVYQNGAVVPNSATLSNNWGVFGINSVTGTAEGVESKISEVIVYPSNQNSNIAGINTNINSFYSIYPVPPVVSDPDAQAFVDRVFAAGGSVTSTEANAVNTLTIGLKASGIWSLMKVIYPFVGASAAACAQNLKSSSFTGTFVNPWTFTSAGIQQFGTSHMNTNFNNQANWTSTSNGSMGFVSATNETGTTVVDMGTSPNLLNLNDASAICANYNGTYFAAINCTSIVPGVANPSTIGFFVTSRLNSSTFSKYKRGSSTINLTNTDPIGTNTNTSIYLSAGNQANNALFFSKKLYNFCFIGDGLTQTQVDDYWTLLQTFNSSLGR
jgi:hypothetical protein